MGNLYGEDVPYIKWREAINQYKEKIVDEDKRVYTKKRSKRNFSFCKKKEESIQSWLRLNTRVKVEMYLKMENLYALFDQNHFRG